MLPDPIVEALPPHPHVVEVGVGGRFDLLEALGEVLPGARRIAVDVDPAAVEGAPEGVAGHVHDVRGPGQAPYHGVDLVVARRPPVELQPAIARRARRHGAALAMRALKDEWADLDAIVGKPRILGGAEPWRWWPAPEPGSPAGQA